MIKLELREVIQNIYLFTDTYFPFVSMKSELKENSVMGSYNFIVDIE